MLSSTKVELEETLKKCDILKEDHVKQVEELKDDHQRELFDRGERLKEEFSKEQRKCLQKIVNTEENYKKQLRVKREKFNEELKQKEDKIRMALLMTEENIQQKAWRRSRRLERNPTSRRSSYCMKRSINLKGFDQIEDEFIFIIHRKRLIE